LKKIRKKRQYSQKNRNIEIEKTLETNNKNNITKFFNKHNKRFCFEKTLEIAQTIENGNQHEKK